MDERSVVDQQIQMSALFFYAGKQCLNLRVIGVITDHRDTAPAGCCDCGGGVLQRAMQGMPVQIRSALRRGAASDVHGHAGRPKGQGDALAHSATGAGNDSDLLTWVIHSTLPNKVFAEAVSLWRLM
ncbi:hypothetical protein D3C85_1177010 [compost metagenome]